MTKVAQPETREQIRERILTGMASKLPGKDHDLSTGELCDLVAMIASAGIDAALEAEGKACARIADDTDTGPVAVDIARAIRARGSK